jgi:hypothetical protein
LWADVGGYGKDLLGYLIEEKIRVLCAVEGVA